ncbi:uncharacterized protein TNIN_178881 [Trichonephila inaurata madagascariensis]|uniref:DUF382 domain-containing protein n=1 Tax=Trichonephila inaurata madagascariensis TaxID=2747483 RepID=A0A8X6X3K5_9ARAC|nr:uncharacterized protein TNIN_178881 [Trichonephila inaurata madagascariensis]
MILKKKMCEEKGETSVDVIKDKDDLNPVILSKERVDSDDYEEEKTPKLPERKPKKLSRMTIAKLQQTVGLKASRNMVFIPQNWSFRRECSQDKSRIGKLAWKLMDFIKRVGTTKMQRSSRERENRKSGKRVRFKLKAHDNFSRDGKVRGETRPLDIKVVDPAWMEKRREYLRKLDTRKWTFACSFVPQRHFKMDCGR